MNKKILYKASVFITVLIMAFSSIGLMANKIDIHSSEIDFINMGDLSFIKLSNETQIFSSDPGWLYFHYGYDYNAVGITSGGTFEAAIRLTPDEFQPFYCTNCYITKMKFYHHVCEEDTIDSHSGKIKIYGEGTPTTPGPLITSEPYTVVGDGWFEVPLSSPCLINCNEDLWISVEITHASGEYPIGIDAGPAVVGKGDWLYYNGTWMELSPGIDVNWCIEAWGECYPLFEPYIIEPSNQADIYKDTTIIATELLNPEAITSASFEYSSNGWLWTPIGIDYDGTVESKATNETFEQWGFWTADWEIESMNEGWYYLRVTMTDSINSAACQIKVYVDPTPPIPIIVEPDLIDGFEIEILGPTTFIATTTDENIVSMTLEYYYLPFSFYFEKGIPLKNQHDYGPLSGHPEGSKEWNDDSSCGPTSAGASIWYWAKKYPAIYGNLIKENGKQLTQKELIDKLHGYTGCEEHSPRQNGDGVSDSGMENGIKNWLKDHGDCLTVEYVKKKDFTFKKYMTELLKCEDLLVSTDSHWMVGNSVNLIPNADGTYNVDFMDPWTGKIINVKMSKDGSFTVYGRPKDTMFCISPCPEKEIEIGMWELIGKDTIGVDGWSVFWDTSFLNPKNYYLIQVSMTDANGHIGKEKFLVNFLDALNEPPNKPECVYDRNNDKLSIIATDPDGDQLRYGIDWNSDGTVDQWTDFVNSGTQQSISCEGREGPVGIIAEDTQHAQSDWVSIKTKNKEKKEYSIINLLFQRYFQLSTLFEKILKQYFN